jgi:tetratricopeptide (TPR) repeat protein
MRMMRYFIRLDRMSGQDKLAETRDLKEYLDSRRRLRVAPELLASVYAELGGYWIDKRQLDQVPGILFKAMDARVEVPEIHYQLARYYRAVREQGEEEKALEAAITLLERTQPLDKKQLFLLIDSYNRRGETYYRRQEYLDAEKFFRKAITEIEQAQARKVFGMQPEFGLAYKNQGDLYYYVGRDLVAALDLYRKAAANRYESPDLDYKMGYVHYAGERYEQALLAFSKVVDQKPVNENALFALANALYEGGYYSSAQGYYLRLLEILEGRLERIRFLQVFENPEHRALVERLMKVYNNLGVTLRNLGERSRDPDKESKALVNLTFSSERFDLISRDPETAARGLTQNLAYLNQRGILYPQAGFQLQIYNRLPLDLEALNF